MSTTIVVTETIGLRLLELARLPIETGAVLLARKAVTPDGTIRLISVALHEIPAESYVSRDGTSLQVSSDGYVHILNEARRQGSIAIWLHTHPGDGSLVEMSEKDQTVNNALRELFVSRSESGLYGAIVIGYRGDELTFTGHLDYWDARRVEPIERLLVVGPRITLLRAADSYRPPLSPLQDRHVRAFGGSIPAVLADLEVTVVGAGGVGSAVAEQLVRLGVRKLKLIDHDQLSDTNVTRVYGSTIADVGRLKVDVLAAHLRSIAPDAQVSPINGNLNSENIARELIGSDVVFGCTDDNSGRSRLSRFAYLYLTPVLDSGVLIDSDGEGKINGIFGRVTVLHPGAACLICRDRIDLELAKAEERADDDQQRLLKQGYAPALATRDPAVIAYTTLVAATAVGELLERLVGYGDAVPPSEILLRIHDRRIATNDLNPTPDHYCDLTSKRARFGDLEPFLGVNWAS